MAELLKNIFYKKNYFIQLAEDFQKVYPEFDDKKFISLIFNKEWNNLELKQRMHHAARSIHKLLPDNFNEASKILLKVTIDERSKHPCRFEDMIFPDYVEIFGINYPGISIPALKLFTQYSSSEFAIRPFIIKHAEETMKQMLKWAGHHNHNIRRLATEGCRPRLPWGIALPVFKKDPSLIIPILEKLKDDKSEYVRKSVANNLNDISKDHPETVLKICRQWKGKSGNTDWIIKHALRTLLRKGDREAMNLFGFKDQNSFEISEFNLQKEKIAIGDKLYFSFKMKNISRNNMRLRIEYNIYYLKASGKYSKKTFQITENTFITGEEVEIKKTQSFENMTTRKHYPGKHKIGIVINGREIKTKDFSVIKNR